MPYVARIHPARKSHISCATLHRHLRLVWLYYISCTLTHKRHHFRERQLNIKGVYWFSLQMLSEIFLILTRIQRDIIINVHISSCQVPVNLVRFLMKHELARQIFKKYSQIPNVMEIRPVEAGCSVRTDRYDKFNSLWVNDQLDAQLRYTEWPKKMYTLFTHQYLWNTFKRNFYFRVRV